MRCSSRISGLFFALLLIGPSFAFAQDTKPAPTANPVTQPESTWPGASIWHIIDSPYSKTIFDPPAPMLNTLNGMQTPGIPPNGLTNYSSDSPLPIWPSAAQTLPSFSSTAPETLPGSQPHSQPASQPATQPERNGEWFLAPIPSHKPGQGWGITGTIGYIFHLDATDTISPPSIVAGMGYFSQNYSWAAGLAGRFYLDEDRYRVAAGAFDGRLNYNFYGVGADAGNTGLYVPVEQHMTGAIIEVLRQITPGAFIGPRYVVVGINASADLGAAPIPLPDIQRNSMISGLGVHFQWDTRDSQFFPTKGLLVDVTLDFHDPAIGDSFAYQNYEFAYNQFFSLDDRQVIGVRAICQSANGDVPYYGLNAFGRGSDLRGYAYGQYQDNLLLAGQAEYRLKLTNRFGVVAFAGVGAIGGSIGDLLSSEALPSAGAGLRYTIATKNHLNLRADLAVGRDGDPVFYLAVGEAF